jgi:hypothetical protein
MIALSVSGGAMCTIRRARTSHAVAGEIKKNHYIAVSERRTVRTSPQILAVVCGVVVCVPHELGALTEETVGELLDFN